jgi:hypothetical protein
MCKRKQAGRKYGGTCLTSSCEGAYLQHLLVTKFQVLGRLGRYASSQVPWWYNPACSPEGLSWGAPCCTCSVLVYACAIFVGFMDTYMYFKLIIYLRYLFWFLCRLLLVIRQGTSVPYQTRSGTDPSAEQGTCQYLHALTAFSSSPLQIYLPKVYCAFVWIKCWEDISTCKNNPTCLTTSWTQRNIRHQVSLMSASLTFFFVLMSSKACRKCTFDRNNRRIILKSHSTTCTMVKSKR